MNFFVRYCASCILHPIHKLPLSVHAVYENTFVSLSERYVSTVSSIYVNVSNAFLKLYSVILQKYIYIYIYIYI